MHEIRVSQAQHPPPEARRGWPAPAPLPPLLLFRFSFCFILAHQILDTVLLVPLVILIGDPLGCSVGRGLDLQLVVVAQVAFAGNVGEQMADIGEVRLLGQTLQCSGMPTLLSCW